VLKRILYKNGVPQVTARYISKLVRGLFIPGNQFKHTNKAELSEVRASVSNPQSKGATMVNNNTLICPTCGHKSTEFKHSINKTLILGLRRLYAIGGLSRLDALGMEYTPAANFQKLQYFNLITQI
jgi:hypothetical protein